MKSMIFSIILPACDVSEIGLYLAIADFGLPCFRIGITTDCFQILGKVSYNQQSNWSLLQSRAEVATIFRQPPPSDRIQTRLQHPWTAGAI